MDAERPVWPVAGLGVTLSQSIVFAIQSTPQVFLEERQNPATAQLWLQALQLSQVFRDRLLVDLEVVHAALRFWRRLLSEDGHMRFMLLSRGPQSFARTVFRASKGPCTWVFKRVQQAHGRGTSGKWAGAGEALSALDEEGEDGEGSMAGSLGPAGLSGACQEQKGRTSTATTKMQRRVLLLEAVSSTLSSTLAEVTASAELLHLGGHATGVQQSEELAQSAHQAVEAVVSQLTQQLESLQTQLDKLTSDELSRAAVLQAATSTLLSGHLEEQEPIPGPAPTFSLGDALCKLALALHVTLRAQQQYLQQHLQQHLQQSASGCQATTAAAAAADTAAVDAGEARSEGSSQPARLLHSGSFRVALHRAQSLASSGAAAVVQVLAVPIQAHRARPSSLRAGAALREATQQARAAGGLVSLPPWVCRPSWSQRHWVQLSLAGLATFMGARWVWRHSPAGGSDDMTRWSRAVWDTATGSVQAHVVGPLGAVRDELTRTFNRQGVVSPQEFEADKKSLMRMLADFERDVGRGAKALASAPTLAPVAGEVEANMSREEQEALLRGMQLVMSTYELELRDPVRNLLLGQLARSLLIQVQRLKLDTEAALLEMAKILRANELNISLVAAVPALAVTWGTLTAVGRWLLPRAPDVKRAAIPCRMALTDLSKALLQQQALQQQAQPDQAQRVPPAFATQASLGATGSRQPLYVAQGESLFRLYRVQKEASLLFRGHDVRSRYSEWPQLSADLVQLARCCLNATEALVVVDRVGKTYKAFQS